MRVSDYRRKKLERYASHELFQMDHDANIVLETQAQWDAMHDCASTLASGNTVAVSIIKTKYGKLLIYFCIPK
jgi:hypothetical protein